jgi:hypothetical protein
MMVTTRVRLDRIASSTRNAHLGRDVIVSDQINPSEGYVLAVRILEDKSTYNTVEDLTVAGWCRCGLGDDILAGTLGNRRALARLCGRSSVAHRRRGCTLHVLNLGGVLGRCTSASPELGAPFRVEVLGRHPELS